MIINPITDGIVLDHIQAGKGMELYHILGLDELECAVAIIKNSHRHYIFLIGIHNLRGFALLFPSTVRLVLRVRST